ncbi:MAG: ABC transporter ATP-binding protein, partial [Bacilli bacterium]|nr:ABC transporter ATP-binding protein [Bacilli bacterium]
MIRLMKFFSLRSWIAVFLISGLTVFQVYCTMSVTDYVSGIIAAITYLHYHNVPSSIPGVGPMIAQMVEAGGWKSVLAAGQAMVEGGSMSPEAYSLLETVAEASTNQIWWNAGMMVLFASLTMIAQMVIAILAATVSSSLATGIRAKLNKKISSMSLEGIGKVTGPSLVTRTTPDVQQSQFAYLLIFRMVFAAPVTAVWAIVKIQVSGAWQLTTISAAGVAFIVLGMAIMMTFAIPRFRRFQTLLDRLNGVTRESVSGVRVVRAYNAEEYQNQKFDKANQDLTNNALFAGRLMALMNPWINIVMHGVSLGIYWVGAYLIHADTGIVYSEVTQYMMLSTQIIMSFMMILMLFILLPRAQVSAKRILEVLATPETILDPENP